MPLIKFYLIKNLLIVFLLGLVGCTYTESLDKNFYPSLDNVGVEEKLDLKIGLVNSATTKDLKFRASNAGHAVDIAIGDSVITSMAKELSSIFKFVNIVDRPISSLNIDLYAYPSVEWRETGRDSMSGNIDYQIETNIVFKEKNSGVTIAKFNDSHNAHYSPPSSARALKILEGASLFLLAPITSSLATQSIGEEAEKLLKAHMIKSLRSIGDQITDDINIRNYAELGGKREIITSSILPSISSPHNTDSPLQRGKSISLYSGSGFLFGSENYVITNYHVVKGLKSIKVKFLGGEIIEATVASVDENNDVAFLKLSKSPQMPSSNIRIGNSSKVRLGDKIFTIGYPATNILGMSPKYSEGVVNSIKGLRDNPAFFQISVPIQPGNSGGPLFNEQGEVVGITTSSLDAGLARDAMGATPQNVNYAVKSAFIRNLMPTIPEIMLANKGIVVVPNEPENSLSSFIDRVKRNVVLIEGSE
jgi:S1-C subfamily serine protease